MKRLKKHLAFFLILTILTGLLTGCGQNAEKEEPVTAPESTETREAALERKLLLLKKEAFADAVLQKLGDDPADDAGYAVFISICSGKERAQVVSAVGETYEKAWENAVSAAMAHLRAYDLSPVWVKADAVYSAKQVPLGELKKDMKDYRPQFYRWGVAFDPGFTTAVLEEEMNGAKIYDYEHGGIQKEYLDKHLKRTHREPVKFLPDEVTLFKCQGWFCDEEDQVYTLERKKLKRGHRQIPLVDGDYAESLILNGSQFLMEQVQEDGSFVYGYYPRFDNALEGYNILRHVSTIWSLLCRYRLAPDDALVETIHKTIDYAIDRVVYRDDDTAYLLEEKSGELKLGGNGVAIVALTEYMDVFGTDEYETLCCQLGNGILSMMNQEDGSFIHVLNEDFTLKEEFRTVYYDGEATFALSRLYNLTGDQKWLDAACRSVDHFIREDYTQYRDHWVAYAMNEITQHIPDRQEYYDFAMANARNNLEEIRNRETTYHTYLELLMASFETYERMTENGFSVEDFDINALLETIEIRTQRQLEGYFFPEYAMYMENPQKILDTFMVRHEGYRIRIDDVQHNIGGLYLFAKNYEKLQKLGYPLNAEN